MVNIGLSAVYRPTLYSGGIGRGRWNVACNRRLRRSSKHSDVWCLRLAICDKPGRPCAGTCPARCPTDRARLTTRSITDLSRIISTINPRAPIRIPDVGQALRHYPLLNRIFRRQISLLIVVNFTAWLGGGVYFTTLSLFFSFSFSFTSSNVVQY